MWNRFNENCQSCYKAGTDITVGEKMFPTKARRSLTQYMTNNPDKFRINFWLAGESKSYYILNGFLYLEKKRSSFSKPKLVCICSTEIDR